MPNQDFAQWNFFFLAYFFGALYFECCICRRQEREALSQRQKFAAYHTAKQRAADADIRPPDHSWRGDRMNPPWKYA
jgi:hypothetical protein